MLVFVVFFSRSLIRPLDSYCNRVPREITDLKNRTGSIGHLEKTSQYAFIVAIGGHIEGTTGGHILATVSNTDKSVEKRDDIRFFFLTNLNVF